MLSSVKEAINALKAKLAVNKEDMSNSKWQSSKYRPSWQKWNMEELQDLLNITADEAEVLEGNLQLTLSGVKRFIPLDSKAVDNIPRRK